MSTPDKRTTFSLVMTVHDQAEEIRNELPRLLEQQYEDYEVIVVDEHSSDETADLLNFMKTDHPQLYTTFLPKYQFQQFRRRLAFTLGVKAARKEWIVFTDLTTTPPSPTWLEELSEYTGDSVLILGYVNRKSGAVKLKLFDEISAAKSIISKAEHWREGIGHNNWMRHLQRSTYYDFIAVRADLGHEALRLFA